jgi:hypothetical protein
MKSRGRRTIFLGVLATAVFVWAAIYRFDVPAEEMGRLLLYCVMVVALTMLLAALCVGLVIGVRTLFRKLGAPPPE